MAVSVVVPLLNEEESLPELHNWIQQVAEKNQLSYELIFVDDGSTDSSWEVICDLAKENNAVKAIRFRRNYGKSAALNEGFKIAQGEVVITMDADLQDSPDEIPELYKMITKQGFDLVSGWKKKRHDPITKTIPSKFFNATTRKISGIKLHDFNCGLKAYSHNLIKDLEVHGEMHRYIPLIAKWAGYHAIGEKIVQHRERKYGRTKFGISRFIKGYLDLLSITFVSKFGKRPMHLFGALGSLLFFIGFVIAGYLAYTKIFMAAYRMTERPLFYFGLLAMILGTQLFLTGFLAELISLQTRDKQSYHIKETINYKSENII
ncbi:MAG TPA: glycosyltransferase family 2 protein [Bacteroidales bacterium]|nr:glycosyltransferase family 2 protein [Bacteroidales bacterium]MDD4086308.1 glycosyltransferase family 2 protein [Bacteroidales bacterium]MDY0084449.1 glycosyltransferase family 2 protein [Bacteroidales bacterium]HPE42648.1 glycosyltransferase family 2 protein [Bacteroidales bacterium]